MVKHVSRAYYVSSMPRPHPCHTSLPDLSQELWIDAAVTLTGSYRSADADAQFQLLTKIYWSCAPKEPRIPRKPNYHKAIPSTSFAINDEGVHPAFLLASGLSIPWMLMP